MRPSQRQIWALWDELLLYLHVALKKWSFGKCKHMEGTHVIKPSKSGRARGPRPYPCQHPCKINENVRDNLFSPVVLALLCQKHNIHFTYLGTGCIFKYDEFHPQGDDYQPHRECGILAFCTQV